MRIKINVLLATKLLIANDCLALNRCRSSGVLMAKARLMHTNTMYVMVTKTSVFKEQNNYNTSTYKLQNNDEVKCVF